MYEGQPELVVEYTPEDQQCSHPGCRYIALDDVPYCAPHYQLVRATRNAVKYKERRMAKKKGKGGKRC